MFGGLDALTKTRTAPHGDRESQREPDDAQNNDTDRNGDPSASSSRSYDRKRPPALQTEESLQPSSASNAPPESKDEQNQNAGVASAGVISITGSEGSDGLKKHKYGRKHLNPSGSGPQQRAASDVGMDRPRQKRYHSRGDITSEQPKR